MSESETQDPEPESDDGDVELTEEEIEKAGDAGSDGCHNCDDVGESEMLVVLDRNFEYPWKSGNKYARICPECGSRTFCPESYWESKDADPEDVAYVIEKAEDKEDREIRPRFRCPYTGEFVEDGGEPCGEVFLGEPHSAEAVGPDECPHCERELNWD